MVKEAWDSIKDNIKERITNPFLGTFVIVWIVHNWPVVYSFFYFDKDWKLERKIKYFNNYWSEHTFFWNLICVALITIGILIITYLFLGLSRFMANYFENVVVPYVSKISKGKVVTVETHQSALDRIISLEAKVEAERKAKNEAINERDELEKRFYAETDKLNTKTEDSKNDDPLDQIILSLNSNYSEENIENAFVNVAKNYAIGDQNPVIDFFLKNGFIKYKGRDGYGNIFYDFTKEGEEFRRKYYRKTSK